MIVFDRGQGIYIYKKPKKIKNGPILSVLLSECVEIQNTNRLRLQLEFLKDIFINNIYNIYVCMHIHIFTYIVYVYVYIYILLKYIYIYAYMPVYVYDPPSTHTPVQGTL